MKISELTDAIAATYRVAPEKRRPIFAKGSPGSGKSDAGSSAAEKIAAEAGLPFRDLTREPWSSDATAAFCFMSLQATIEDPITLSGLPARDGDVARFLPFADKLPTGGQGIIEIAELPTAPPAVQAGLYEFFLRGKLGSYRLPDGGGLPGRGWYVYATGNRAQDRAQVQRMPTPLVSRIVHATIQLDLRVWMDWALTSGKVRPEIVAFLNFRSAHPADGIPDIFDTFDPSRADTPYACPRTYHMASDVLDAGHAPGIEHELLSGCIGEGPATELIAFLRVYRDLVSPDAILMSPATAAVPGDLSALYAVCGALARKVSDKSIDRLVIYLDRLPAEYAILTMTEAVRRDPTLQSTAGFLRFAHQYGEILT